MSNSLTSKISIQNPQSNNKKISELTIIELSDLINNLKSENSMLKTQLNANRENVVSYSLYENSLKQKDKII